ncbi:MAG TPA: hypothetical protein VM884_00835 [Flavisolibacter sp.]|nr:hypothetical protein [Flavisolibacter sp.]
MARALTKDRIMEDIYFFLHTDDFEFVQTLDGLKGYDFRHPQLNWVWSTYYRLKQKGWANIHLVDKIPEKGIIVMSSNQGSVFQKFPKDLFVILTVADSPPWFYTQVNISQNPSQHSDYPNVFGFPIWKHIPHWPQPNIIPRNRERGDTFENITFFGDRSQLAPELKGAEFISALTKLGLKFQIIEREFNDYSGVDAVIAIRSFSKNKILNKPYSKLINAWAGGVPIVTGMESSFQSVKDSELDFIAVETMDELINALGRLKENKLLRQQMVANGMQRSKEFTDEKILGIWENLLFADAQVWYKKWLEKTTAGRKLFYADLFLSRFFRSVKKRIAK